MEYFQLRPTSSKHPPKSSRSQGESLPWDSQRVCMLIACMGLHGSAQQSNDFANSWARGQDLDTLASYHAPHLHPLVQFTAFGKRCECNAQKCTHPKRLPPLASHLLLLSHCVLTQHEGPKKYSKQYDSLRESNRRHMGCQNMRLSTMLLMQSNPMGRTCYSWIVFFRTTNHNLW